MVVFHFIEGFDDPIRHRSALGYLSPIKREARKMLMNDGSPRTDRPWTWDNFNPRPRHDPASRAAAQRRIHR